MNTWNGDQQYRLAHEQYLLRTSGFEHFVFYNSLSSKDCYLTGYIKTSCDKYYNMVWVSKVIMLNVKFCSICAIIDISKARATVCHLRSINSSN